MSLTEIENVIPQKNIWVISPHYDDVVLTFGGYFDSLVKAGRLGAKAVRIIHVFSRSNYQARDDKGNRDTSLARVQMATGVRLLEDLNCLDDLLGHGRYAYELKAERECVVRLKGWKPGEAFEFPQGNRSTFDKEDREIFERVKRYAAEWLSQEDTALLVPLGVKEHVDHVIVREAIVEAKAEMGPAARSAVYFGEDQPYTGLADDNDRRVADAFIHRLGLVPVDYDMDAKRKSALVSTHYPSQVEESYITGLANRSRQLQAIHRSADDVERIYRQD